MKGPPTHFRHIEQWQACKRGRASAEKVTCPHRQLPVRFILTLPISPEVIRTIHGSGHMFDRDAKGRWRH